MVGGRVVVAWTRKTPTTDLFEQFYRTWADYDHVRSILEHATVEAGPSLGLEWILEDDADDLRAIAAELRRRGYPVEWNSPGVIG